MMASIFVGLLKLRRAAARTAPALRVIVSTSQPLTPASTITAPAQACRVCTKSAEASPISLKSRRLLGGQVGRQAVYRNSYEPPKRL